MDSIRLPFPDEPTADDARPLVTRIVDLADRARLEEYLASSQQQGNHLNETRDPVVARCPGRDDFLDQQTEATFQLGLAFYAMHAKRGFCLYLKDSDPRLYELQRLLHTSRGFVEHMICEVSRRKRGPERCYPTRDEERVKSLIEALSGVFSEDAENPVTIRAVNMPPKEPTTSPEERVLAEAIEFYRYTLKCIGVDTY